MAESERAVDSSVREVRPAPRGAYVGDPCEAKSFELDALADPEGPDRGLRHPAGFRPVRHDDVRVHAMGNPLNLRNVLVLHGTELRAAVQEDVAEVLEAHLLPLKSLEVLPRDVDLRPRRENSLPAAREFGMKRGLHRSDGRKALDVDRDGIGDEEVPALVFFDEAPGLPAKGLRVQVLRRHLDIREAEAER